MRPTLKELINAREDYINGNIVVKVIVDTLDNTIKDRIDELEEEHYINEEYLADYLLSLEESVGWNSKIDIEQQDAINKVNRDSNIAYSRNVYEPEVIRLESSFLEHVVPLGNEDYQDEKDFYPFLTDHLKNGFDFKFYTSNGYPVLLSENIDIVLYYLCNRYK